MKTLITYYKKGIVRSAFGLLLLSLMMMTTGCPDSGKSKNKIRNGFRPGVTVGSGCPNCPTSTNHLGAALGNSSAVQGVQAEMDFFTGGTNGAGGVYGGGFIHITQNNGCNLAPGRYQVVNTIQAGSMDQTGMIHNLVVEAAAGPQRMVVSFSYISLLAAQFGNYVSCSGNQIAMELVAVSTIEEVMIGNVPYNCGMPLAFNMMNAQPVCQIP